MINISIPEKKSKSFIENFFIKKGLVDIVEKSRGVNYKVNDLQISAPYKPVLNDLYRLFQFNVKKNINGINTGNKNLMSMTRDVLKFEYFFTPSIIIVVDCRSANAKFLKDNLIRKWKYIIDKKNEKYIFLLKDEILGKYNLLQNKFFKSKKNE